MGKELDRLLQSIEEAGGFRDACTVFQKNKVEELEEGIRNLSGKCRMWRVNFHSSVVLYVHVHEHVLMSSTWFYFHLHGRTKVDSHALPKYASNMAYGERF